MTALTPAQVGAIWLSAGGSLRSVQVAIAVATAESGRNPAAISPDGGYGLFQIQASVWVGALPITKESLLNADDNARVAVYISHAGTNWAAWCTMWSNPVRDCGHGYITTPQRGSAAYRYMSLGAGMGGKPLPPPPPGGTGSQASEVEGGWQGIRDWFAGDATARWRIIDQATKTVKGRRW